MRTSVLAITGALSYAGASAVCANPGLDADGKPHIRPGLSNNPDAWRWQVPIQEPGEPIVTPTSCVGRAAGDSVSPMECASKCNAMNAQVGIANAKMICMNSPLVYLTHNGAISFTDLLSQDRSYYMWSSVVKTDGVWTDPACTPQTTMLWGTGLDTQQNQLLWEDDTDSFGETPVDAAVWVVGSNEGHRPVPTNDPDASNDYGNTPFLTGVTSTGSNPMDVFCGCQWDPYTPPACATTTYQCCDGTDTTMAKVDFAGTNCVGTAAYTNSDAVSKAVTDSIAAAVGLGTGILVAVIVAPIVGLILLIVCIVCCCKHCGQGGKPSA